jgi:SGNH hydrolase-like domain, acetyltransferase AlgX
MPDQSRLPTSRWDRLVAVAFVASLAVPGLALIAGIRPPELENRAEAALPTVDAESLTEPGTYQAIDDYVTRNLPARDVAVDAYATLDYGLLGGSTDPDVVLGRDDWLFFAGELMPTCVVTPEALIRALDAVAARAEVANMQFRFGIAPDKHAIYPEQVRTDPPMPEACTDAARDEVRAAMAARPDVTVDMWSAVLAERDRSKAPLYFSQDSHWTPHGAMPAIAALVESLAPGVWDPAQITVDGTSRYPMELARLIGKPRDAIVPRYVVRPSVAVEESVLPTTVELGNAREILVFTTSGTADVVPGTTLVVYDSFLNINRRRIAPWFQRTVWVHAGDLRDHPEIVDIMPTIDTIVLVRVERGAYEMDMEQLLQPVIDQGG